MNGFRRLAVAFVPSLLISSAVVALASAPEVSAAVPVAGYWTESAYATVFEDSRPSADAGSTLRLDTARNEYEGAQIVMRRNDAFTVNGVTFTGLTNGAGGTIPAANLEYKFVEYIQLKTNSQFGGQRMVPVTRPAPARFPDGLSNEPTKAVPARTTQPIWVRVFVPGGVAGGLYRGNATVRTSAGDVPVPIEVDVRAVTLPEAASGTFTSVLWNQFGGEINADQEQPDLVKEFYGLDKYSDAWFELLRNVSKEWKAHRTNNATIGVLKLLMDAGSVRRADGTYAFNWTRFDQVVETILAGGGIKRIEGFYWGGGPDYNKPEVGWQVSSFNTVGKHEWLRWNSTAATNWFSQFIPALKAHLDSKGWASKFWMHVGDEVHGDQGETGYRGTAAKIRTYWPDVQLGDAMVHDPWVSRLASVVDVMVPQLRTYSENPTAWDTERAKGKELWLYTANAPTFNYLNRAIDQPQWAQRQIPWFAFSRGGSGYLHWAFNNWRYPIDNQDLKGDGWISRPDVARRTVQSTVRYESLRDGIEDFEVLSLLGQSDLELARNLAASMVPMGDKYSPDTNFIQRTRRILLDLAAGRTVPDLARTAAASATSGTATNAIDGNPSTVWQPSGSGALTLDLGRQVQVDVLKLAWSPAASVKLEISYDASRWTVVPARQRGTALNVKARYLRLTTTGGLASVEVHGDALAARNLAGGKAFSARSENPHGNYPDSSGIESTDGLLADEWSDGRSHGYTGTDGQTRTVELTLDLGAVQQVDDVKVHAYEEYPAYRPDTVRVLTSVDGVRFVQRSSRNAADGAARVWYDLRFGTVSARYVKVALTKRFTTDGSAMFVDEIEVYESASAASNLALGRTYTKTAGVDAAYPDAGSAESTDGLGAGGYTDGLGFGYRVAQGTTLTADVTLDLGASRSVSRIRAAAFNNGVHSYAPDRVQVVVGGSVLAEAWWPHDGWFDLSFTAVSTRSVTLRFAKTGGPFADYLFLDEIEAYGPGSHAVAASYTSSAGKDPAYGDGGSESTDGILAGHYVDGLSYAWQLASGETRTVEVSLDLGAARSVDRVAVREYFDGSHTYRPDQVVVLTSADGATFVERGRVSAPTSRWFDVSFAAVSARHVKVQLTKTFGSFAEYIFLDEITVHAA